VGLSAYFPANAVGRPLGRSDAGRERGLGGTAPAAEQQRLLDLDELLPLREVVNEGLVDSDADRWIGVGANLSKPSCTRRNVSPSGGDLRARQLG
jgi:hypothetical protein